MGNWLGKMVNVRKESLFNIVSIFFIVFFLFSCESEKIAIPEGFQVMKSDGPYNFVHMDKKHIGDKVKQRRAGNMICAKNKSTKYCEVYFWIDKKEVQTSMPMIRTNARRGVFYLHDGKVKLTALK